MTRTVAILVAFLLFAASSASARRAPSRAELRSIAAAIHVRPKCIELQISTVDHDYGVAWGRGMSGCRVKSGYVIVGGGPGNWFEMARDTRTDFTCTDYPHLMAKVAYDLGLCGPGRTPPPPLLTGPQARSAYANWLYDSGALDVWSGGCDRTSRVNVYCALGYYMNGECNRANADVTLKGNRIRIHLETSWTMAMSRGQCAVNM